MAEINLEGVSKFFKESGMAKNALNSIGSNKETLGQKIFRGAREIAEDTIGGTKAGDALFETSQVRGAAKGEKVLWDMNKPEHLEAAKGLYKESMEHSNTIEEAINALENSGKIQGKEYTNLLKMRSALRGEDGASGMMGDISNAIQNNGTLEYNLPASTGEKIKNTAGQIKDYYTKGDAKDLAIKAGITGGAYMGGAIGLRYLSGGTLTTNNNGESDIAGIPFI